VARRTAAVAFTIVRPGPSFIEVQELVTFDLEAPGRALLEEAQKVEVSMVRPQLFVIGRQGCSIEVLNADLPIAELIDSGRLRIQEAHDTAVTIAILKNATWGPPAPTGIVFQMKSSRKIDLRQEKDGWKKKIGDYCRKQIIDIYARRQDGNRVNAPFNLHGSSVPCLCAVVK
jgi:hypothetical protein